MAHQKFALALVTGATSGIGESLCHLLANQGVNLIITGRNNQRLRDLTESLNKKVNVIPLVADLSTPMGCQQIINAIHQYAPDLVVNNAGLGLYGDAIDHSTDSEVDLLNVNAHAVLKITLEAAKTLQDKNKNGVIMNIASAAAFLVFPGAAVYAAAKAFVVQLSQALDLELQPRGIRVLVSCPGMVDTNFNKRAGGKNPQYFSMSSEFAAEQIWWQIQSGKCCHTFDWKTRWGTWLSRLFPTKWIANMLYSTIKHRTNT